MSANRKQNDWTQAEARQFETRLAQRFADVPVPDALAPQVLLPAIRDRKPAVRVLSGWKKVAAAAATLMIVAGALFAALAGGGFRTKMADSATGGSAQEGSVDSVMPDSGSLNEAAPQAPEPKEPQESGGGAPVTEAPDEGAAPPVTDIDPETGESPENYASEAQVPVARTVFLILTAIVVPLAAVVALLVLRRRRKTKGRH